MTNLWPIYSEECIEDCVELLRNGKTYFSISDKNVQAFETIFKTNFTNHKFTIFANSATSIAYAVYAYLKTKFPKVKKPNMVVPAHTYRASVLPLLPLKISPRFYNQVQIGTIEEKLVEALIDENTIGILITHLFGITIDLHLVYNLAERFGIPVIEDCSHAHGASVKGAHPGDRAFAAYFSTGTKKLISGGMGGVLCTSDHELHNDVLETTQPPKWAKLKSTNSNNNYFGRGFNMRGTPISARLALDHASNFPEIADAKNKCMNIVKDAISKTTTLELLHERNDQLGTYYNLPFYINDDIENITKEFVKSNLRLKKYQEFLPDFPIFQEHTRNSGCLVNNHRNLFYFDTRDMYGLQTMGENYARQINKL